MNNIPSLRQVFVMVAATMTLVMIWRCGGRGDCRGHGGNSISVGLVADTGDCHGHGNDDGSDTQTSTVDAVASQSQNVLLRHSPNSMDMDVLVSRPFALVDEIADASPAAEDGLQLGDQILKYGNVEAGDNLLQRLSSESQSNQGHMVPVVIMRQGTVINLTITPRTWQGSGLLGCHFRIL